MLALLSGFSFMKYGYTDLLFSLNKPFSYMIDISGSQSSNNYITDGREVEFNFIIVLT